MRNDNDRIKSLSSTIKSVTSDWGLDLDDALVDDLAGAILATMEEEIDAAYMYESLNH